MRAHRAITLLELLVSLSLLAAISVIMASWLTMTLRTQSSATADAAWNRSAIAVLALIERDLLSVDRLDIDGRRNEPRIEWINGELRIRTRENGAISTIEYTFNKERALALRHQVGDRSQEPEPPLLGEVGAVTAEIVEKSEFTHLPILHVRLERLNGQFIERSYTLSVEDLQ